MRKTILTAAAVLAMAGAAVAVNAAPASARPPGNCDTSTDIGQWDSRHDSSYVGGTWINCGNRWDYVYIEVNNASDSTCVWVAAQSALHVSYNPVFWGPGGHGRTWKRCAVN
jgi:hypothetical protein